MFGRGWERARATVIAAQQMDNKPVYTHHGGGTLRRRQEYVLDVQPPGGGPLFRTTVLSPLDVDSMRDLSVGEVVPVLCQEKSQRVKFDTSDPAMSHDAVKSEQRARFEEIAHAPPGGRPGEAPVGRSERRGPDLSREALLRQREKLRVQQQAQDEIGAGEPADPLGQLAKLADLHDRGVLTDAEFAAEKAKILGES